MNKEVKFDANELLETIKREMTNNDIFELYKALVAYNLGMTEVTKEDYEKLNRVIDFYWENDEITSFINQDVIDYAERIFEVNDETTEIE